MSSRLSVNNTSTGSTGSNYQLPELSSRRSRAERRNASGGLDASRAVDCASSSDGPVVRRKSSRRTHLKIPSSFLRGNLPTAAKRPEQTRPVLTRRNAFREKPAVREKPGITRKVAGLFNISQLSDVRAKLDGYEQRKQDLDTRTSLPIVQLKQRVEARLSDLHDTEQLLQGRFLGVGVANEIEDIGNQVRAEKANLSRVYRLLNDAESQGITIDMSLNDLLRISLRYIELGVPFNAHTLPNQLFCATNANRDAKRPLGSGAMNTVWLIPYADPKTGKTYPMVFKPELDNPEMVNADAVFTGIGYKPTITKNGTLRFTEEGERKPANLAGRSVATYRVDQLLDLRIVPPTYLTVEGGQVGTVMALAPGYAPAMSDKTARVQLDPELAQWLREQPSDVLLEYAAAQGYSGLSLGGDDVLVLRREGGTDFEREILGELNFNDPELRDQAINLQFLDALCGQVDRNSKNLFVDGRALSAIDNDLAFGQMAEIGRDKCPALPTVVSAELRTKLLALTDEDLRATLSPLLEKAEVDATVERLHVIQEALKATGDKAILVVSSAEEWQSEEVTRRLGIVSVSDRGLTNNEISDASEKSYLGRESAMQAVKSAENDKQSVPRYRIPLFSPDIVRNDLNQLRAQISAGA